MSLHPLAGRRNIAAWLSALCFFLLIASLLDGVIAGGRRDPNMYEVLPGQDIKMSNSMPPETERLDQLWLRTTDPAIKLVLEDVHTGFWMGGRQWQATVSVPASQSAGDYAVSLSARNETSPKLTQTNTLRVYASETAMRQGSLSLLTSTIGLNPFLLALCLLPLGIASAYASTKLSRRINSELCAQGLAQIFRVMKTPEGLRVFFSLGARNGLKVGDDVELFDSTGAKALGTLRVDQVRLEDSESLVPVGVTAAINCCVRLRRGQ